MKPTSFKPALMASTLCLLVLSGCATQTAYRPAEKRGEPGYTETQLTDTRYRVTFNGNARTPQETTQDYALLRAAELTLQKGYDWFRLADRDTSGKVRNTVGGGGGIDFPSQTSVYQRCGMLSCDTVVASSPGFSSGVGVSSTTSRPEYSSSVEIVMGKNPMPDAVESYDARQLASTLRRNMDIHQG